MKDLLIFSALLSCFLATVTFFHSPNQPVVSVSITITSAAAPPKAFPLLCIGKSGKVNFQTTLLSPRVSGCKILLFLPAIIFSKTMVVWISGKHHFQRSGIIFAQEGQWAGYNHSTKEPSAGAKAISATDIGRVRISHSSKDQELRAPSMSRK